jgi:hypothetical protein
MCNFVCLYPRCVEPSQTGAAYTLDVIKDDSCVETLGVGGQKSYVMGRNSQMCDLVFDHLSLSRKHAVLLHDGEACVYVSGYGANLVFFNHSAIDLSNNLNLRL